MADKLAAFALAATTSVASYNWLSTANDVATFVVTIIAAIGGTAAAAHQYEKWRAQRKARKDNDDSTS